MDTWIGSKTIKKSKGMINMQFKTMVHGGAHGER